MSTPTTICSSCLGKRTDSRYRTCDKCRSRTRAYHRIRRQPTVPENTLPSNPSTQLQSVSEFYKPDISKGRSFISESSAELHTIPRFILPASNQIRSLTSTATDIGNHPSTNPPRCLTVKRRRTSEHTR